MRKTFRESELSSDVNRELSIPEGVQGVADVLVNGRLKGTGGWTGEPLPVHRAVCSESLGFKDSVVGFHLSPFAGKDCITCYSHPSRQILPPLL